MAQGMALGEGAGGEGATDHGHQQPLLQRAAGPARRMVAAELAARRASGESGQPAKGAAQSAAGAGADDLKEPSEEEEEEEDAGMFSEAELEQLRESLQAVDRSGAGLVRGSEPERELQEVALKLGVLQQQLNLCAPWPLR